MSQNAESKFVNTKNKKFDFFKSCIKKEVWKRAVRQKSCRMARPEGRGFFLEARNALG